MSTLPVGLAEGRWVGKWYEWPCVGCGCLLASREPSHDAACASCRAMTEVGRVQRTIKDLTEERNAWRLRATKAELELKEANEAVRELRGMLERATTEPPDEVA